MGFTLVMARHARRGRAAPYCQNATGDAGHRDREHTRDPAPARRAPPLPPHARAAVARSRHLGRAPLDGRVGPARAVHAGAAQPSDDQRRGRGDRRRRLRHPHRARPPDDPRRRPRGRRQVPPGRVPAVLRRLGAPAHQPGPAAVRGVRAARRRARHGGPSRGRRAVRRHGGLPARAAARARPAARRPRRHRAHDARGSRGRARRRARGPPRDVVAHACSGCSAATSA